MSRVEELQLSEIIQSLQSEDKKKRLKALEKLQTIITDNDKQWNKQEILAIWNIMNKFMAKHLTDAKEECRYLTVDIIKTFLELIPAIEKNIVYVMPVLVRRLAAQELLEPSEEVRLNCIYLLRRIIQWYADYLAIYIDDLIGILAKTVTDSYPKVKRESCEAIAELARTIPTQFYSKSETVVKPLLSNFTHQHYRVRVTSINAIGEVLQHGNSKSIEDVSTPMAERLFDQSAAVRAAVIEVAGRWLLNLRDRYSWWYKIVPLLLTGLHDEIAEIRLKAEAHWEATGQLYLQENDSDEKIKDKMDFLTKQPHHYPPNIQRPNLGCRIIIQQNIGRLIGGIGRELGDWMADVRVRSAQLLAVLVLNVEQDIIQHIEKLLPAIYRACNDHDERVVVNVVLSAEYMGYFVPAEVYCPLILPTLEDGNITAGHLAVFAAILRGSERKLLLDKLQDIGKFLNEPHICRSKKTNYQEQILRCCEALLCVCQDDCDIISNNLFTMILTVWSMAHEEKIQQQSSNLMETLAKITNNENTSNLYACHLREILCQIKSTSSSWSIYSPELYIFKFCLTEAKSVSARNTDLLLPIFKDTMGKNSDAELRLKLFIMLSEFFQQSNKILRETEDLYSFIDEFLEDILLPGMIWSAGKASEAIRTAALGCLCALIDNEPFVEINKTRFDNFGQSVKNKSTLFADDKQFLRTFEELKPILMSLVDDNARKTRLYALRAICLTIDLALDMSCAKDQHIIDIYPVIIKRLDDGCNDVRWAAVEALVYVWRALSDDYDLDFGKSHVDYLYTTTIVHLDDPDSEFQEFMLDAMMQFAKIHPEMLAEKINRCKNNFRNQKGLDKLLKNCHELLKINK